MRRKSKHAKWFAITPAGTSRKHHRIGQRRTAPCDDQFSRGVAAAPASIAAGSGQQPSPSQRAIGDFSPKLADLTDNVRYGDVWERTQFSKRDRSLATVAALIAMNRPDRLRSHLARARAIGMTKVELIEVITQMAFYAGWPSSVTAIAVARKVFQ
jgi:4-carboxymuconolactone decarboxylase